MKLQFLVGKEGNEVYDCFVSDYAVYLMSEDTYTVIFLLIYSAVNDDDEVNLTFAWEIVRKKLLDSLNIIENKGIVGNGVTESGQQRPASLFAIAEAPRFRLLLASFHRLRKEAGIVSIMFLLCIYIIYLYYKNVKKYLKGFIISHIYMYNEVESLLCVPYEGLSYFYLANWEGKTVFSKSYV